MLQLLQQITRRWNTRRVKYLLSDSACVEIQQLIFVQSKLLFFPKE
jgi:hypothetical protein